ncbi:hypothetical protein EDEG_01896 [Edhazardia aedis USNM 41457]|uniref:Uncharacterized protein n=1 Tax=Edhazardia aedis (strain USNM 41457) TaxID=1003232 RepID=J9D8F6_EDHAE|nr:hypothetical protein EDEG_01896 [Edhazardia aedis USNM 41457]|eukprot:EJW03804.1 hypothetical protein EDEG_01896 [Edhazardia aedis USNM 41457]
MSSTISFRNIKCLENKNNTKKVCLKDEIILLYFWFIAKVSFILLKRSIVFSLIYFSLDWESLIVSHNGSTLNAICVNVMKILPKIYLLNLAYMIFLIKNLYLKNRNSKRSKKKNKRKNSNLGKYLVLQSEKNTDSVKNDNIAIEKIIISEKNQETAKLNTLEIVINESIDNTEECGKNSENKCVIKAENIEECNKKSNNCEENKNIDNLMTALDAPVSENKNKANFILKGIKRKYKSNSNVRKAPILFDLPDSDS